MWHAWLNNCLKNFNWKPWETWTLKGKMILHFFKEVLFHESDLSVLVTDKHGKEHSASVVYNENLDQLCN